MNKVYVINHPFILLLCTAITCKTAYDIACILSNKENKFNGIKIIFGDKGDKERN